jgi:hypothetical protein
MEEHRFRKLKKQISENTWNYEEVAGDLEKNTTMKSFIVCTFHQIGLLLG